MSSRRCLRRWRWGWRSPTSRLGLRLSGRALAASPATVGDVQRECGAGAGEPGAARRGAARVGLGAAAASLMSEAKQPTWRGWRNGGSHRQDALRCPFYVLQRLYLRGVVGGAILTTSTSASNWVPGAIWPDGRGAAQRQWRPHHGRPGGDQAGGQAAHTLGPQFLALIIVNGLALRFPVLVCRCEGATHCRRAQSVAAGVSDEAVTAVPAASTTRSARVTCWPGR